MGIPFVGYGNEKLDLLPEAHAGDIVKCVKCMGEHELQAADNGSELLLVYHCGRKLYLAAVGGKLVMDVRADFSGEL